MLLGVDTGGTFTDFVLLAHEGLRFHKELSTPDDPFRAVAQGIEALGLDCRDVHLVHGSTVATNAILERKGARVLLVTNAGFEDLLEIGRQARNELYRLQPAASMRHVLPAACAGLQGRIGADGAEVQPLDPAELSLLRQRAHEFDAIAVCLLFSFLRPDHETAIGRALDNAGPFVALSHEVLAEHREYERASTTFLNAYVGPLVQRYLQRIEAHLAPRHFFVMHSGGGVMDAELAGKQAVKLALSGPAGGLVATAAVCRQLGIRRALTFDMGGTSTDVSLIDGEPVRMTSGHVAGMPVSVPMMDIHTIGAGGGSLAWIDDAGLPRLGPESAGANPGPACYGRGGRRPTVTDANVVLGRIPPQARLAGRMALDRQAAWQALADFGQPLGLNAEDAAQAVIDLANEHMLGALRVVSVQRGYDPAAFVLVCFGGAGGLHACALAESLGMRRILLPLASGAFSALGMIVGRRQSDLSLSRRISLHEPDASESLLAVFRQLQLRAQQQLAGLPLEFRMHCDVGFAGQGFHLNVPFDGCAETLAERFRALHARLYGHTLERNVEAVTMRLTAVAESPTLQWPGVPEQQGTPQACAASTVVGIGSVPHYARQRLGRGARLAGPALIVEDTATFWLQPGWELEVAENGHILVERSRA